MSGIALREQFNNTSPTELAINSVDYIVSVISELKSTPSSNAKKDILSNIDQRFQSDFLSFAHQVYSPFTRFFVSSGRIGVMTSSMSSKTTDMSDILSVLEMLSSRKVTGNKALQLLTDFYNQHSSNTNALVEMALAKTFDCGVSVSTLNKVFGDFIPDFKVALCEQSNPKTLSKIKFPAYVQEKFDGMRLIIMVDTNGGVTYHSRNGNTLNLQQFDGEFSAIKNMAFDGELLITFGKKVLSRKEGNGILNSIMKGGNLPVGHSVKFVLWDMLSIDEFIRGESSIPYSKRYTQLQSVTENFSNVVEVAFTKIVNTLDDARGEFQRYLDMGREGIILKNIGHPYKAKRTADSIKFKAEITDEFMVIDIVEGTGKYVGMLGALVVKKDDITVSVGSGFTDADRVRLNNYTTIGKLVEVRYNEVITNRDGNKSLFLPIFVCDRFDKDEKD